MSRNRSLCPQIPLFFIIGAGRSGTTLLRLIRTGHSRLHIPRETWSIRPLVRELPVSGELTPSQVDRAVTIMTEDHRWPDMEIMAEDPRRWAMGVCQVPGWLTSSRGTLAPVRRRGVPYLQRRNLLPKQIYI